MELEYLSIDFNFPIIHRHMSEAWSLECEFLFIEFIFTIIHPQSDSMVRLRSLLEVYPTFFKVSNVLWLNILKGIYGT